MKVWNYIFISLGMIIVLYIAGFDVGSAGTIFKVVGLEMNSTTREVINVTTSDSTFINEVFKSTGSDLGILAAVGLVIAGVVASFVTRSKAENLIILGFILAVLVLFISALVSIMTYAVGTDQNWVAWIIVAIMLPFTIGYIVALIEFFRGTD